MLANLLWAHIDPGTKPGKHHHHPVLVGEGEYRFQKVPHWGELPGGKLIGPTHGGVVVDPVDGRVYVSTDAEHAILVYEPDGVYIMSFGGRGKPEHGRMLTRTSHGLKVDTRFSPPRLLVCDRENRRLFHTDLYGNWIGEITTGRITKLKQLK